MSKKEQHQKELRKIYERVADLYYKLKELENEVKKTKDDFSELYVDIIINDEEVMKAPNVD